MEKKDKKSNDPRFAAVYNDPKFRNTRRKDLKIKLDSRFSAKDLEFKKKSKVDKYGRRLKDTLEIETLRILRSTMKGLVRRSRKKEKMQRQRSLHLLPLPMMNYRVLMRSMMRSRQV